MIDRFLDLLLQATQTATAVAALTQAAQQDARSPFEWLGTAADVAGIIAAVAALIAWWRARKAATDAQEAVRDLRNRRRHSAAYLAALDARNLLRLLLQMQSQRRWDEALQAYRDVQDLIDTINGNSGIPGLSESRLRSLEMWTRQIASKKVQIDTALGAGADALVELDVPGYNEYVDNLRSVINLIVIDLENNQ